MRISLRFKADIIEKDERTMKKNKSSVSFKETVRFALRGFKVWWRENPQILLSVLICGVIDALTPYADIWLLARLIDEIAGGRDPQMIKVYVLALMSTTAILTLLCAGLTRWKNVQLACLWHTQNKVFMEKLLSMDFADMDDGHVPVSYTHLPVCFCRMYMMGIHSGEHPFQESPGYWPIQWKLLS